MFLRNKVFHKYVNLTCILRVTIMLLSFSCSTKGIRKHLTPEESMREDMILDPVQIMNKYGYQAQNHTVITEDGYILEIHRMLPNSKSSKTRNHPVFLMHGLGNSAFEWLSPGVGIALPYLLSDEGFDIWFGNARGTIYSRKHVNIKLHDPNFWNFSWHEIGYYDLPAFIDYIVKNTSSPSVHYIGVSQGCTVFFVMASMRPAYNKKIQSMTALAPPVFFEHSGFLMRFSAAFRNTIKNMANITFGIFRVPPPSKLTKNPTYLCKSYAVIKSMCETFMYSVIGEDKTIVNRTVLPLALSHFPGGFSVLQYIHYFQLIDTNRFSQFDYEKRKNLQVYGTIEPPDYPLDKVTAPVALHYANNDCLVSPEDVKKLKLTLPNVILYRKAPHPRFNHIDFLIAVNVSYYVYDSVISVIKKQDKYRVFYFSVFLVAMVTLI